MYAYLLAVIDATLSKQEKRLLPRLMISERSHTRIRSFGRKMGAI